MLIRPVWVRNAVISGPLTKFRFHISHQRLSKPDMVYVSSHITVTTPSPDKSIYKLHRKVSIWLVQTTSCCQETAEQERRNPFSESWPKSTQQMMILIGLMPGFVWMSSNSHIQTFPQCCHRVSWCFFVLFCFFGGLFHFGKLTPLQVWL